MAAETSTPGTIPVYGALIEQDDLDAVSACLQRGWLGMGADVNQFEAAVIEAIGTTDRGAVALTNGGAALHVAMMVAGVGPGHEVIVPSLCHLSNVQAVLAVGATPVFCDVDAETMCIDPECVAALVNERTKAVVAIDYGCYLCDHDALAAIASRHNLRIVHDAAHSFGSSSLGRNIGSFTDICMFSFDPVKSLTGIDAGVLVLADPAEQRHAKEVRILGSDQPPEVMYKNARTWDYDAVRPGYRYHLTNVHAAMGKSQVAKLDRIRSNRQDACVRYAERLKSVEGVFAPPGGFDAVCPFLYFIRVDASKRDALRAHLKDNGIETGMHWRPAHEHTFFQQFPRGPLPVSIAAGNELISLPLHSAPMSDELIDRVCDSIVSFLR